MRVFHDPGWLQMSQENFQLVSKRNRKDKHKKQKSPTFSEDLLSLQKQLSCEKTLLTLKCAGLS